MLSYCLKCRKNTESKNLKVAKTHKGKQILLSKLVVCNSKEPRFIKKQEASGLVSELGLKIRLSRIRLLGDLLLLRHKINRIVRYQT